MKFEEIRVACCEANQQLPATGLVDLTFGNVSVLDAEAGVFAIKPSGVDYAELTPESMVLVDLDGNVVEGSLRYSSDTPTHRCLLKAFLEKGIRAIVHTHSRNAVGFAQAGMDLPCLGTTHCDYFNGPVPVTRAMTPEEVESDYEWNTGKVILERFKEINPAEVPAVLVRNHGPFTWGQTAAKAVANAQALEIVADMAIKTLSINPDAVQAPSHLLNKHFLRKHGKNAYYGQK
jgi:L-ribulose-5-phosphate 4-epimerase